MLKKIALAAIVAITFISIPSFAQSSGSSSSDEAIKVFMGAAVSCSKSVQQSNYAAGSETDCVEVKRLLDTLINSSNPMSARNKNYAIMSNLLVHQTIATTYAKIDGLGSPRGCTIVNQARTIQYQYVNGATFEADETMDKVITGIDDLATKC